MLRAVSAVLVIGLLLSGCAARPGPSGAVVPPSGASTTTPHAPITDAGAGSGTIEGSVVTEEMSPIAEATVTVRLVAASSALTLAQLRAQQETEYRVGSDADGSFLIKNLAEGQYTITAAKKGFHEAVPRSVVVKAEQTAEVRIILVTLPSDVPSHVTIPFVARLNNINLRTPLGDQSIINGGNLNPTDTTTYRYGTFHPVEESTTALLQTLIVETTWTPTLSQCTFGIRHRANGPGDNDNSEAKTWIQDVKTSGSQLRIEREGGDGTAMMSEERSTANGGRPIQTTGRWFFGASYVFAGTLGTPVDVSCAIDQRINAWGTFFMVASAPADFTAAQ